MVTRSAGRVGPIAIVLTVLGCSYGAEPDRSRDFVLVYAPDSETLDPAATAVIGQATQAALAAPALEVTVAGYADDPATPEAQQIVSRLRAQLVADALLQAGVGRRRIHLSPRRAIGADPATERRRVEIRIAP